MKFWVLIRKKKQKIMIKEKEDGDYVWLKVASL